eukprot:gnl/TRDRNA2_/TRDRNA2_171012_c0_seq1.p1 gnl/TRDRNA2_/TRDRNA2_171012_c0~~gnl/TRDRNA2_/TRDRNA2_171012_c0_seq1.p1  ORF type:complete len:221 (-),score=25.36 gnl/TRDRNA2_/TRDRNA2_171012_c0_seq1:359-1021(-)
MSNGRSNGEEMASVAQMLASSTGIASSSKLSSETHFGVRESTAVSSRMTVESNLGAAVRLLQTSANITKEKVVEEEDDWTLTIVTFVFVGVLVLCCLALGVVVYFNRAETMFGPQLGQHQAFNSRAASDSNGREDMDSTVIGNEGGLNLPARDTAGQKSEHWDPETRANERSNGFTNELHPSTVDISLDYSSRESAQTSRQRFFAPSLRPCPRSGRCFVL